MKRVLKGKIPDDYLQRLLPQHARTAEFYGLPKPDKPGNPLRPIVSPCGDPLDKLSWFLQTILTQLLAFVPAHLSNTIVLCTSGIKDFVYQRAEGELINRIFNATSV